MPGWFFDTSALAKLYHPEVGAEAVERILTASHNRVWISRLGIVEFVSSSAKKVRTGSFRRDDVKFLLTRFNQDVAIGRLRVVKVREAQFAQASHLLIRYALDLNLRSLDAIQLACASRLKSLGLIHHFVASDRVLCEIAAREGFSVLNPETAERQ